MKLNIIFLVIIILLLFTIKHLYQNLNEQEQKLSFYKQNNNILFTKIRSIYNEKLILETKNRKLKELSLKDSFNWNQDISNTAVIKQLQKD